MSENFKKDNNTSDAENNLNRKKSLLDNLRKGASGLASQAGKFAAEAGEKIKDAAEDGAEFAKVKAADIKEQALQMKKEIDRKLIRPFSVEDLCKNDQTLPNVIRIFGNDKKMENEICENAVGFMDRIGEFKVLNIQEKHAAEVLDADIPNGKVSFVPFVTEGLYYNDPYLKNRYINLDGYFKYIEKAKLAELDQIAHKLGAKHFKVNLMEERKSFASVKGKEKVGLGAKTKISEEVSANANFNTVERLKIIDENFFTGCDTPEIPELVYFKGNADIQSLIDMRMNGGIVKKTYYLNYLTSAEFSMDLAKKIDGAIEHYKFTSNASVSSEIEREKRLIFEYIIEF